MTSATFDTPDSYLADIAGDYTLDTSHTHLGFSARHAMVTTVRGQFKEFSGTAHVDTENPGQLEGLADHRRHQHLTGNAQRDGHLLSGDFFETEANPNITFESTDVSRDGDDWTITGDLTIKGVSKPVTIEFEFTGSAKDPFGNDRIGFEGKAAISRKDWGLTYNAALETGGVLVSDKIKLDFDVSAIRNA